MSKLYEIFFSATDTTRKCVATICKGLAIPTATRINLADNLNVQFPELTENDIVVVAAPVYGGRLPIQVSEALGRLKGNNAIAIAVVVYGNRDYDDALLELTDLLKDKQFRIAAAGAFIGQHAIFPKVATDRPDLSDERLLFKFGQECGEAIKRGFDAENVPYIKGHQPYKKAAGVSLSPKAKEDDCAKCGICVDNCPTGAISADTPYLTDTAKCISCGRCIKNCSQGARHHSGFSYSLIGLIFKAAFSKRREPEWRIAK